MAGDAMADAFDPYQSWLEIPLSKRPPSDCDLVGVEEGETDLDRIREAAAARIEEIRKLTLGPQREHAFRLLDEVSEALVSLLKGREVDAAETKEPPILAELVTQPKQPVTPEAISPFAEGGRADTAAIKGPPPPVEFASQLAQPAADVPQGEGRRSRPIVATDLKAVILVPVRLVDRLLGYVAGEGNDILHNFLRVVTVVLAVTGLVGLNSLANWFVHEAFVASTPPDGGDTGIDQPEAPALPTPPDPFPPDEADMDTAAAESPPPDPFHSDETDMDTAGAAAKVTPGNGPLPTAITNSIGMKLVLIPAGEFLMGSPDSDKEADENEKPQHLVQITKPFHLSIYEVTQGEYEWVLSQDPSAFSRTGGLMDEVADSNTNHLPAKQISWEDAMEFCRKLSAMPEEKAVGQVYRLPTEAEWEYACRAGSATKRSFGDSESQLGQYAWYDGNSGDATHPVGQKKPNAWGLYDMHGNMNEWCADWYDKRYYAESARINPIGPTSGGERVVRGGAWGNKPPYCRSANRGDATPSSRGPYLGFRVASAAGETNASGKSREEERPEELAPEEPEPEPPATTVRTRNPRNSDSSKVPSVAKTMWAGTDSDGDYYEYHFKKGGALHYKSPSGFHDNGTWKQDGISIYCEMNNKYSERRGSIRGERIEGDAWNVKGKRWTWSVEKQ